MQLGRHHLAPAEAVPGGGWNWVGGLELEQEFSSTAQSHRITPPGKLEIQYVETAQKTFTERGIPRAPISKPPNIPDCSVTQLSFRNSCPRNALPRRARAGAAPSPEVRKRNDASQQC